MPTSHISENHACASIIVGHMTLVLHFISCKPATPATEPPTVVDCKLPAFTILLCQGLHIIRLEPWTLALSATCRTGLVYELHTCDPPLISCQRSVWHTQFTRCTYAESVHGVGNHVSSCIPSLRQILSGSRYVPAGTLCIWLTKSSQYNPQHLTLQLFDIVPVPER